jgi:uncharacterized protein YchJ
MEWWDCFHQEDIPDFTSDFIDDFDEESDFSGWNSETVVRVGPKIGRNDPCPCGSGKKYKKCCLE